MFATKRAGQTNSKKQRKSFENLRRNGGAEAVAEKHVWDTILAPKSTRNSTKINQKSTRIDPKSITSVDLGREGSRATPLGRSGVDLVPL